MKESAGSVQIQDKTGFHLRTLIFRKLHALETLIHNGDVITTQQAANVIACEVEKEFDLHPKNQNETV